METEARLGAVCYIDLLGFSYLTTLLEKKEILKNNDEILFEEKQVKNLTVSDLRLLDKYLKNDTVDTQTKPSITVADWAYRIVDENLRKFHEIIEKQCARYQSSDYSVISDSVFIVDESSDNILCIVANIFRECIKSGILLRAGLAYGSYFCVRTHLSNFNVYGPTVTRAVNYEKQGKGCRIFTDSEFPRSSKAFSDTNSQLFFPYKNYKDYSVIDCFEWLMIKDTYVLNISDLSNLNSFHSHVQNLIDLINDNIEIICNLCYSPKFEWNLKTKDGIIQLGASIVYLSDLMSKIYSNLKPIENDTKEIEDVVKYNRSEEILKKMIESQKKDFCVKYGI